jgi:hypothetical protein
MMNWYASARRMSICDSCRSNWPGERPWQKGLRSCTSKSNKKGNSSIAYSARASAAAVSTTAASSTKYAPVVKTK